MAIDNIVKICKNAVPSRGNGSFAKLQTKGKAMDNAEEIKKLEQELAAAKARLAEAKAKARKAEKSKGEAKPPVHEPPKTGITELCFVVDRSGSMWDRVDSVVSGFNATLASQKSKKVDRLFVSTVLFDDEERILHDRLPVETIRNLTTEDYRTGGSTALLDAVGGSIDRMVNVQRTVTPENRAENVVFVIITDGMENASRRYSRETVRRMVQKERDEYGWEFIFLGADIDSFAAARDIGIGRDRTSNFVGDEEGVHEAWKCVDDMAMLKRRKAPMHRLAARMCEMHASYEKRANGFGKPGKTPKKDTGNK